MLVHVFDVSAPDTLANDMEYFEACIGALHTFSPEARLAVLLHKTDLLAHDVHGLLRERETDIKRRALPSLAVCFATSIWNESLYRAWSAILAMMVPNRTALAAEMARLMERCRADEAILYEAKTLLSLCHVARRAPDAHRAAKVSTVLRQMRLGVAAFDQSARTTAFALAFDDGLTLTMECITNDAFVVIASIPSSSTPLCSQAAAPPPQHGTAGEIAAFRPIFAAVIDAIASFDPHTAQPLQGHL